MKIKKNSTNRIEQSKHRTVEVYRNCFDDEGKVLINNGVFHQFGLNVIESEEGNTTYSVAIVELPDGTIITPAANMIRFTSPPEFDVEAIAEKERHDCAERAWEALSRQAAPAAWMQIAWEAILNIQATKS